ncbi:MAG: GspH/FimT family protein [Desulfobacterales bacterium]|nr:GspH/FimT family protein [Desulfobacterales bacterium]MDJ0856617.1 GspH/FimT family protein [Desulfobacterales bacterium]MDJ0886040.1 GspH/FimT family protein [Desulfobacterales bacterium]MDJ0990128.1 GspH/FimT family protein [Desulfobacterales bacterium]
MERNKGFTVLELAVVVGIVAIVSAISIPAYLSWRDDSRARGAAAAMRADFERAKMRAIRENANVRVEFAADNVTYTVHTDLDSDNALDADEDIVARTILPPGVTFSNNFGGDDMSFSSRGIPAAGLSDAGTVTMRSTAGREYSVIVSRFGRIRTE